MTITCLPYRQARYAAGPQHVASQLLPRLTLDQKLLVHDANTRKVPRRASRDQRGFHYPKIGTYYKCTTAERPWGCSQRLRYVTVFLFSTPSHRLVYIFYFVVHIECKRNKAELVTDHTIWKVRRVLIFTLTYVVAVRRKLGLLLIPHCLSKVNHFLSITVI